VKPNDTVYRVNARLLTVHASPREHGFVTIPTNSNLRVISALTEGYLLQLQWGNEQLVIFARDVREKAMCMCEGISG
jgi:hypothetical protein